MYPHLAKDKNCTGCLACYDACNHNAIKIITKTVTNMFVLILTLVVNVGYVKNRVQ